MPRVHVTGFMICRTLEESDRVAAALPAHIALTRAEPGCLIFEVLRSSADPCRFAVRQCYRSPEAYDAHHARTLASDWWKVTSHVPRDFRITESG